VALSPSAEDLYARALDARGVITITRELAEDNGALQELISCGLLGLAWPITDGPLTYAAVEPERAAARWRSALEEQAAVAAERAESLTQRLTQLTTAYSGFTRSPSTADGSYETIVGLPEINRRVGQNVASCTREILALHPKPRDGENLRAGQARDLEMVARPAMDWRVLYLSIERARPATLDYASTLTQAGAQFRTAERLVPRLIVVDAETAVVAIDSRLTQGEPAACVITDPPMVAYLRRLFFMHWQAAQPLCDAAPKPPTLEADQTAIVALLNEGLDQAQIARRLRLNRRTLAAHVAQLKSAYRAQTLYQLGAAIAAAEAQHDR
jgi:hypothetical protein